MGDRLTAIAASDAAPVDKLDRFVAAFVIEGQAHAHVAPIMLREIAEGGRRLDEETYTVMVRVVRAMTGIITEGRAAGQFGPVDPILLYLTTVWPIVVYLATTPIRSALARVAQFDVGRLDPERFIAHLQMLNRRAVMPAAARRGTDRRTRHDPAPSARHRRRRLVAPPCSTLAAGAARSRRPIASACRATSRPPRCGWPPKSAAASSTSRWPRATASRPATSSPSSTRPTSPWPCNAPPADRLGADAQLRLLLAGARQEDIRQAEAQRAAAEADVAGARQELASAERDLKRFEALLASNSGAQKPRDDAATRRDVAKTASAPERNGCGPPPKPSRG